MVNEYMLSYTAEEVDEKLKKVDTLSSGADGITPHIGSDGNWYIGDDNTGVNAQGSIGPKGEDGFSPTITENSNNNQTTYQLDITTKAGKMVTPNLMAVSFVENADVYSQLEKVVGTWVDGKPLYRRTQIGTLTSGSPALITISNVDIFIHISGVAKNSAGSAPFPVYVSSDNLLVPWTSGSTVYISVGSQYVGYPYYINILYTKTTDAAVNAVATAEELAEAYGEGVQSA